MFPLVALSGFHGEGAGFAPLVVRHKLRVAVEHNREVEDEEGAASDHQDALQCSKSNMKKLVVQG